MGLAGYLVNDISDTVQFVVPVWSFHQRMNLKAVIVLLLYTL